MQLFNPMLAIPPLLLLWERQYAGALHRQRERNVAAKEDGGVVVPAAAAAVSRVEGGRVAVVLEVVDGERERCLL